MNDSMSFIGGGGFSQSAGNETKSESKSEGVLPCFIKMIQLQPDDIINLFGMEYKMVTIVGIVRNITNTATKTTFEIEDLSGSIEAHLWIEEDDVKRPSIMINSYVRVVGAVRSNEKVKSIMLFKIHPVKGINELNTHYLEVINARYQAEAYARGVEPSSGGSKMEVDMPSSLDLGDTLRGKEGAILNLIRSAGQNDSGIPRDEIHKHFPKIPQNEIRSILDGMVNDGHIYTTIDQDHFQACF